MTTSFLSISVTIHARTMVHEIWINHGWMNACPNLVHWNIIKNFMTPLPLSIHLHENLNPCCHWGGCAPMFGGGGVLYLSSMKGQLNYKGRSSASFNRRHSKDASDSQLMTDVWSRSTAMMEEPVKSYSPTTLLIFPMGGNQSTWRKPHDFHVCYFINNKRNIQVVCSVYYL